MLIIPENKPSGWIHCSCCNWPEDFPYKPDVQFRVWHDREHFNIIFRVSEETTKAEQDSVGAPVHRDSCVECFIQPEDGEKYYNFEWNAAGHLAMAWRSGREDAESAPADVIESVSAVPSLGSTPFGEKSVGKPWTLEVAIPVSALFRSSLSSWKGLRCRINFFKCGDGLKKQAFLSWAPIDTPTPDFHRPEFFREAVFE